MPTRIFDARPDRLDLRDLPYRPPLRSLAPRFPLDADVQKYIPSYVAEQLVLDQGSEGACTGFGLACVANYLFWVRHIEQGTRTPFLPVSPRMFYELAKRYDEWPGTDYEGSSCRGALKGWNKHGVCSNECWPYRLVEGKPVFARPLPNWELDAARRPLGVYYRIKRDCIVDLQAAITEIGAIYVSANAHDGWDALSQRKAKPPTGHAQLPEIEPITKPKSRGGHAFALVGYNERGFVVQNSWGTSWGASGFAVLPYDDWIVNGTDAWACALGVPAVVRERAGEATRTRPLTSSRWRVGRGSLTALGRQSRTEGNPADDPWPIDHVFEHKPYQPWSTAAAYEHTLVTGNNGELVQTDFTRDPADRAALAQQILVEAPQMWLASTGEKVLKLAIYAHGGLNDEESSIRRSRVLGPCFEGNGIYPVFLTWKTGVGESINDMIEDWARRALGDEAARSKGVLDALGDAKDRAVEAVAHTLFKGLWTEMRDNAAESVRAGRGLDLLARNVVRLQQELAAAGKQLELHLVGHSAGSILLGHFLTVLSSVRASRQALAVKTSTLWAAACSCAFANEHYAGAQEEGVLSLSDLRLYVLSDENEEADALPTPAVPVYGKSLLYLVSRALDDARKMPLLGMQRAELAAYERDDHQWAAEELASVRQWLDAWQGTPGNGLLRVVETPHVTVTREGAQIQATHGSFDNNIDVVTETIERIKGARIAARLEWLDY